MRLSSLIAVPLMNWLHRLGGPGLILLGVADQSVVPLPGSMDVLTIVLAASHPGWWPYYAVMATVGSLVGGFLTYRLAEKGGKETLEKKIGGERAEKVYKKFEKRGFVTVFVGAILPPPFPIVPFLMAAGALQYPTRKFLGALGAGRGLRFVAVAYLGHRYGKSIIGFLSQYRAPALYTLIGLAVAGGIGALVYLKWHRTKRQPQPRRRERKAA